MTNRFQEYLFQFHDEATIKRWAVSLSYFRFCRAYGGHANDGDHLLAALKYMNELDYRIVLDTLGLKSNQLPEDETETSSDQKYPMEIKNFKFRIKDLPQLEQIGHCRIDGHPCFLWASLGTITLSVSGADGNIYEVTENDIESAKQIESRLHELSDWIIDPPQDDQNCICPKYYAGYWQTQT